MEIAIAVAVLFILIAMGTPIGMALFGAGALGLILIDDFNYAGNVLGGSPFLTLLTFTLVVVPMYMLIGIFAVHGRIAEHVFTVCSYVFQRVPGGLGAATVMACAGFAAVSGSSVATAATMARLSIDQMIRYGYPASLASAIVASAGTLGTMIPPSIILVFYSVLTGESTGRMLMAGIVPGLISAATYIAYILWRARRSVESKGYAVIGGRTVPLDEVTERPAAITQLLSLPWRGVFRIGVIFMVVIGGISSGIFTPTESGAIGALVALLMMLRERRRDAWIVRWNAFTDALKDASQTTSFVFFAMAGSAVFTWFLTSSGAVTDLTNMVLDWAAPGWIVVLVMLLVYIPLGTVLEAISILILTMPLIHPIATDLGFDGIWLGIMATKLIELGLITPPSGATVFVVAGSSEKVTVEQVYVGVVPFMILDVFNLALLFIFPQLVLFLPNLIFGA